MRFEQASGRIRIIVVGILMSIALMFPQTHIASHNPLASNDAGIERHLQLKFDDSDLTAHTHHNGTYEEADPGHQHGHNSADHSHHTVFISAYDVATGSKFSIWPSAYKRNHLSPFPFQWQRPPKHPAVS